MMNRILYFHKKNYYTDEVYICSGCNHKIQDTIFWVSKYFLNRTEHRQYCLECSTIYKRSKQVKGVIEVVRLVGVRKAVPRGSLVVTLVSPQIGNVSKISSFVAANRTDGAMIKDNTVYAGRETFEGSEIGVDISKQLEQKDKPIEPDDAAALLSDLTNAEIEHKEKKQIGVKQNDENNNNNK